MTEIMGCPFCGRDPVVSKDSPFFSVTCSCGNTAKTSIKKAIESWNRRTPEPGTSVIRWTRYDGTPETLPEEGESVLFHSKEYGYEVVSLKKCPALIWLNFSYSTEINEHFKCIDEGDLWAYLPEPPEGME